MKLFITCAALALVLPGARAADKNEDKAKEAAVAFLKTLKAKDTKAAMKATALPFVYDEGKDAKLVVIGDELALELWLEAQMKKIKDADQFPTDVESVAPLKELKNADLTLRGWLDTATGKDGYVATVPKLGRLVVRVKDGKAVVVGLLK